MEAHPASKAASKAADKESFTDVLWRAMNEVDFKAQKRLNDWLLISQIVVAVVSFLVSYVMKSFQICILAQLIWACFLWFTTGFGWPWLKTNSLTFLPAEVPKQYRMKN